MLLEVSLFGGAGSAAGRAGPARIGLDQTGLAHIGLAHIGLAHIELAPWSFAWLTGA